MRDRYALYSGIEELEVHFLIDLAAFGITPNYNVALTQEVSAIFHREGHNGLDKLHLGIVLFRAKGASMINACLEIVAAKPSFRNSSKERQYLIPTDGLRVGRK